MDCPFTWGYFHMNPFCFDLFILIFFDRQRFGWGSKPTKKHWKGTFFFISRRSTTVGFEPNRLALLRCFFQKNLMAQVLQERVWGVPVALPDERSVWFRPQGCWWVLKHEGPYEKKIIYKRCACGCFWCSLVYFSRPCFINVSFFQFSGQVWKRSKKYWTRSIRDGLWAGVAECRPTIFSREHGVRIWSDQNIPAHVFRPKVFFGRRLHPVFLGVQDVQECQAHSDQAAKNLPNDQQVK